MDNNDLNELDFDPIRGDHNQEDQKFFDIFYDDEPNFIKNADLENQDQPNNMRNFAEADGNQQGLQEQAEIFAPYHQIIQQTPITTDVNISSALKEPRQHTGFKLLLTVANKFIPKFVIPNLQKTAKKIAGRLNKNYNQSTFVKQIIFARVFGILDIFTEQMPILFQNRINKIAGRQGRIAETTSWRIRFIESLKAESLEEQMMAVWKDHNHQGKFEKSLEDVKKFEKQCLFELENQV